MNHSLDLLDDLPQQADKLLGIWPKEKWHPRALKILEEECSGDQPLGIAYSGGSDSTFCLLLIFAAFPKWRKKMMVLHYNHQLRGAESDCDESFVSTMSRSLGLRCLIEKPSNHHKRDENTLRMLRLEFWKKLQQKEGINTIIQGHHLDDVAETFLWRIPRGTSVDGLISPKPVSKIDQTTILRPFVCIAKDSIRESLENCSVPWKEDTSNQANTYLRNKMRNMVLPHWKKASDRDLLQGIASTRELLQNDSEALEFHALESLQQCRSGSRLKLATLQRLPLATQKRVLQKWIGEYTQKDAFLDSLATKAAQLVKLLLNAEFSVMQLSDQYFVRKKEDYLELEAADVMVPIPYITTAQNCSVFLPNGSKISTEKLIAQGDLFEKILGKKINPQEEAFLSADNLKGDLFVRSRFQGDTFMPLGAPGAKKVSDWMIDRKWTEGQKVQTPVFLNSSNEIVWIPGFPPAEFTRVSTADKWVIRLTYRHSGT
ncbi:MAG: tRNA lysidine(34) synthetase TilS [Opitutae bacterium]